MVNKGIINSWVEHNFRKECCKSGVEVGWNELIASSFLGLTFVYLEANAMWLFQAKNLRGLNAGDKKEMMKTHPKNWTAYVHLQEIKTGEVSREVIRRTSGGVGDVG